MSKDKSIRPGDLPASVREDKIKQPEEFIDNDSWEGAAKAPGKESVEAEKISFRNLEKGKKTGAEPPADEDINSIRKINKP